ncbi:DUF6461 domain-containing protein [Streptomyces uncialis]|uniref:DUF6461 domain-containing protein n=1 Tax=Streptomyces uncialis TaxID=1048205 RepID=UPI0037F97257
MNDPGSSLMDWAASGREVMWCVTFTRGVRAGEVLARYGASPEAALPMSRKGAWRLAGDAAADSVLRAGTLADWTFCFEESGILGADPAVLRRLSQDSETCGVLLGADGMNGFAYWKDGKRIEAFEPGFPSTRPRPPHP